MPLHLDAPSSLLPLASLLAPLFGLLVKRYGNRFLSRCERMFRRKPLPRAERRARRKRH